MLGAFLLAAPWVFMGQLHLSHSEYIYWIQADWVLY